MANLEVGAGKSFADVQSAINAANSGDTIRIFAGTYTGNVNVTKNGLTITNQPGEAVVLEGTGGYAGVITVAANVTGTTLTSDDPSKFKLQASATQEFGLYLASNNDFTSVFNLQIESNKASGNAVVTGANIDNVIFQGNVFSGVAAQLVYVNGPASLGGSAENNVSFVNNQFTGTAGLALGLESSSGTISGNVFSGTSATAIGLQNGGYTVTGNTFTYQYNTYFGGGGNYEGSQIAANNSFTAGRVTIDNKDGVFGSIQRAVNNSANGDSIRATSGTFTENLTINKDVTLFGANAGVAGSSARGAETNIVGGVRATANGVTVDGVKISGASFKDSMGLDRDTGFVVNASQVAVMNSLFQGNNGLDTRPMSTSGTVADLLFTANKVAGWSQGIYIVSGHQGLISDNQFIDNGNGVVTESTSVIIGGNSFKGSVGSDIASASPSGPLIDVGSFVLATNTFDATRPGKVGIFVSSIEGPQSFTGTAFDDGFYGDTLSGAPLMFAGGAGAERIFVGKGNDIFDGGANIDTAIFQGPQNRYIITKVGDVVKVQDTLATGDGTDSLANIENLQFNGGNTGEPIVTIASLFPPPSGGGGGGTPTPTPNAPTPNPNAPTQFVPPVVNDPSPNDGFNEGLAAAAVALFFAGAVPTPAKQVELNAFANLQYEAYKAAGVLSPAIGAYEALGRGFAETIEFSQKYGALSEAEFIAARYAEVFGRDPTAAQQAHFQAQIDYFELLYENAGITSTQADLFAKGAALGQMIGHALLPPIALTVQSNASFNWDLAA